MRCTWQILGKATKIVNASSRAASTAATTRHESAAAPLTGAALQRQIDDVFAMRQSPSSLYEQTMHSNTLTDHPLTHRTSSSELAYRKRKLTERGEYEGAAVAEAEVLERDRTGRAGAETREYFWAVVSAVVGYLLAHALVFRYYYPDDVRLSYLPDRGYTDDVAARRDELQAVDELVGLSVLESVYDRHKAAVKHRLGAA